MENVYKYVQYSWVYVQCMYVVVRIMSTVCQIYNIECNDTHNVCMSFIWLHVELCMSIVYFVIEVTIYPQHTPVNFKFWIDCLHQQTINNFWELLCTFFYNNWSLLVVHPLLHFCGQQTSYLATVYSGSPPKYFLWDKKTSFTSLLLIFPTKTKNNIHWYACWLLNLKIASSSVLIYSFVVLH